MRVERVDGLVSHLASKVCQVDLDLFITPTHDGGPDKVDKACAWLVWRVEQSRKGG